MSHGVALGDLNGDGKLDIVVANTGSDNDGSVSVLLGRGDGTFADSVDYPVGGFPNAVVVGDLNADGKLDVIIADSGKSVLLGKGDDAHGYCCQDAWQDQGLRWDI